MRGFLRWALLGVVALGIGVFVVGWPWWGMEDDETLTLVPPALIKSAAAEDVAAGASIVEQEAGISAYFKADTTIDLNLARTAFRTIEDEGAEYLIGSVAVPDHDEGSDVHVYLHKDGWFLAYYLKTDYAAKIVNFQAMNSPTLITKFETVLTLVADAAGLSAKPLTYYEFRYPNANRILYVYEDDDNGDDFQIKLPSTFTYFERSVNCSCDRMTLNDTGLHRGVIPATALLPDVFHTFRVNDSTYNFYRMAVIILYRE
jgi:hypothetical protein